MEENYRQQVTQLTEKHLAAEAHSKEAALHIDLLNREKSGLFGEVERLRREVASLQKTMDGGLGGVCVSSFVVGLSTIASFRSSP